MAGARSRVSDLGHRDDRQWRTPPRWPMMAEQADEANAKSKAEAFSDLSARGDEDSFTSNDKEDGTDEVFTDIKPFEPQPLSLREELVATMKSSVNVDVAVLKKKNAILEEKVATFKEELAKLKDGKTQAESITENVIKLPGVIVQNINFLKESIGEEFRVDCGPEEIGKLKEIIEDGRLQIQEIKDKQFVQIESISDLTSRIAVELKRRAAFQLKRGGQRFNDATLPVGSLRAAYARSLLICTAMVGIQTVGPSTHMPEALCGLLARWEGWRAANQIVTNVPTMVLTYMATDTLLQTMEVQSTTTPGERAGVDIKVARMVRTGLVSGFLTGFLNTFYQRWLSQQLFPFPGFLQGRVGLAAQICAALPVLYRVAIDLTLWKPIVTTLYITLTALLKGQPRQIIPELKAKVLKIWAMSPRYWLFADLINFSLVSIRLRPLASALFNVPWGAYLSRMANLPDFESPKQDVRRDYAQLIINNLQPEDGEDCVVDDDDFKQFWKDNSFNNELAEIAEARRNTAERFWRKPVEKLTAQQQAALVVKLLAELKAEVPPNVVSEMRVVLAQVKEAEDNLPQDD